MPDTAEKYPNYAEMPQTPAQDGPGVTIRLSPPRQGAAYRTDEPILLHGKYGADGAANKQAEGAPLTHMQIRVGTEGQEEDKAFVRTVQDAHHLPPPEQRPVSDGDYTVYGYFNLDLVKFSKVPTKAGKYWVTAQLLDYKSKKIEFEVK